METFLEAEEDRFPVNNQSYSRMTIPGRIINNRGLGVRGGHAMPGPGYFTPQQWATLSHDQRD